MNPGQDLKRFAELSTRGEFEPLTITTAGERLGSNEVGIKSAACLYPKAQYRIYPESRAARRDFQKAIRNCALPFTTEVQFKNHLRVFYPELTCEQGWKAAESDASRLGVPIGFYAFCQTIHDKSCEALFMLPTVSPRELLNKLQSLC